MWIIHTLVFLNTFKQTLLLPDILENVHDSLYNPGFMPRQT